MSEALFTTEDRSSYPDDDTTEDAGELLLLNEAPDEWVSKLISKSKLVQLTGHERELINSLLDQALNNSETQASNDAGTSLAAAFDLLVAVEYYARLTNTGWLYCPVEPHALVYHFTNTCPRCALSNAFHFHPARKPASGTTGGITRRLLCLFLVCLFERNGKALKVYTAPEPVDILIHDEQENVVMLAEAKAAPLTTLPILYPSEAQRRINDNGEVEFRPHEDAENSLIVSSELQIMLPTHSALIGWTYETLKLEPRTSGDSLAWAYQQVKKVFGEDDQLFSRYLKFWQAAFKVYNKSERIKGEPLDSIYWLTNGCGVPKPRPEDWPRRKNGSEKGYESVSDGKSSVGLDRTDDIKKGIYQVLKIATAAKPKSSFNIKTALLSNVHAVQHHSEYLSSLQDVVWTQDATGRVKTAKDLPDDQHIYNLFDGIISFTRNHTRDEWVELNFRF